ncbi:hypothetical protein L2U69_02375 [Zavarzinia compransoris]|uniref:hypothetical protein n=1 Tax=Zavarzinia marina TaxID=2911065 RepID=UPI001F2F129D|nr:hypothetical protein [Zavarzinia marina]MCF4164493.1 hypothetical protein [Zavarzinia marina]
MTRNTLLVLGIGFAAIIAQAPASLVGTAGAATPATLASGRYACSGGFGTVEIDYSTAGYATGLYTGTWVGGKSGWLELKYDASIAQWRGTWGEAAVGRAGYLTGMTVTASGFSGDWGIVPGMSGNLSGTALPDATGSARCTLVEGTGGDDGDLDVATLPAGTYRCGASGFGTIVVTTSRPGFASGSYDSTWDKSAGGWVELTREGGVWRGRWGEPAVGRQGIIENVEMTRDAAGVRFRGVWRVDPAMAGTFGGRPLPVTSGPFSCG